MSSYKILINPSYEWDEEAKALNISHGELEVFALLVDGHDNKEIAQILGIEYQSVKNRRYSLTKKLKVNNIGQGTVFLMFTNVIKLDFVVPIVKNHQMTKKDWVEGFREMLRDEDKTVSKGTKKAGKKFLVDHGIYKKMFEDRAKELKDDSNEKP